MRIAEEHRRKLKRTNQINCHKQPLVVDSNNVPTRKCVRWKHTAVSANAFQCNMKNNSRFSSYVTSISYYHGGHVGVQLAHYHMSTCKAM